MNSFIKIIFITFLLLFCIVTSGYACIVPGHRSIRYNLEDLVDITRHIVLAEVEKIEPSYINDKGKVTQLSYHFVIKRIIKTRNEPSEFYVQKLKLHSKTIPSIEPISIFTHGELPKRFIYSSTSFENEFTDYNGHNDPYFWEYEGHHTPIHTEWKCTMFHKFQEGEQYLFFLDSMEHGMASEWIRSENDKWYLYVKNKVNLDKDTRDIFLTHKLLKPYWYFYSFTQEELTQELIDWYNENRWRKSFFEIFDTPYKRQIYMQKFPEVEHSKGFYQREFNAYESQ